MISSVAIADRRIRGDRFLRARRSRALSRNTAWCEASLLRLCFIQIFSLIYLQKLAIPFGSTPISLLLVIQIVAAGYLFVFYHAKLDIPGLLTFLAFTCLCLFGQMRSPTVSWASLIQLFALNATFVVVREVPRLLFYKILALFHRLMILPACIVIVQRVLLSAGVGDVLNMEKMLPKSIMLPGYFYAAEFGWATGVIRPNGFFFLEPSFASGFMAAAAIVEYVAFHRIKWAAFFVAACLATYGSTGIVVLAVFAICILARNSIALLGVLAVIAVAALAAISADASLMSTLRLDELSNERSSGFSRLVSPILWLGRLIMDGRYFFRGDGAGSVSEDVGAAWPTVKLAYEYGLAAAVMYLLFIVTTMRRATLPVLMIPLLFVHQLTGGYLVQPAWIGLIASLCTMFVVTPVDTAHAALNPPVAIEGRLSRLTRLRRPTVSRLEAPHQRAAVE